MTKSQKAERADAIAKLRGWIHPGDTVYTILDHVSSSGMSRAIRVVVPYVQREARYNDGWRAIDDGVIAITDSDHGGQLQIRCRVDHLHPNHAVGVALGLRHWKRQGREQDALVVGGCGMDMGFHLVYELSHVLFGNGYQCLGKGACPSNYHTNHRARLNCDGVGEGDTRRRCYAPTDYGRFKTPAGWPRDEFDVPLACLVNEDDTPGPICPTCKGAGTIPNPEGPERFDLLHTDGYALRHRWL